jgi:hypothetical protein
MPGGFSSFGFSPGGSESKVNSGPGFATFTSSSGGFKGGFKPSVSAFVVQYCAINT